MSYELGTNEQKQLLKIAREAIETSVCGEQAPILTLNQLPEVLQHGRASFVTLTIDDKLRGCIGVLEACQPLAIDVQEHAIAAALQDYRFPVVTPEELQKIHIEISILTPKRHLDYDHPEELVNKIRPGIDGVILQDGRRKATFLPQVWQKIPEPSHFLSQLCLKMGVPADLWRHKKIQIAVYQVQEFHE